MHNVTLAVLFGIFSSLPIVASAQTVLAVAGLGISGGLGEQNPAPQVQVLVQGHLSLMDWETISMVDFAKKYTGHGWITKQAFDVMRLNDRPVGLLTGVEYAYRDGGPWHKQTLWVRVGIAWTRNGDIVKILLRTEAWATDTTNTHILQIEARHVRGSWMFATEVGGEWFTQPNTRFGMYMAVRVGHRL